MPVWGVWSTTLSTFRPDVIPQRPKPAANPACTITNDHGEEAVIVEGSRGSQRPAALERIAAAYLKNTRWIARHERPIFTVRPKTVFGFIEKSFPKSATRWRLSAP